MFRWPDVGFGTSVANSSGMNATPAVSQSPIPNDPAQTGGAGSADSTRSGANSQDFAVALSDAGPKAARRPAPNKAHAGGAAGGQLPVSGNLSPPAPLPATSTAAAAATAGAVSGVAAGDVSVTGANAATGGVAGAVPSTLPAAVPLASVLPGTQARGAEVNPGSVPQRVPVDAPVAKAAADLPAGVAQPLDLPGDDQQEPAAAGTAGAELATTPQGASPKDGAAPALIKPAAGGLTFATPAAAVPGAAVKPTTVAAAVTAASATMAAAAATSGPSASQSTDSTSTDTTAQAPTAAALAAAVSGVVAASDAGYAGAADSPSSTTDDLATPATGSVAADGAASNGATVPAALGLGAPSRAAVAAAAAPPINAPAVAALAGAGTAEKHSQGASGNILLTDASGNSIAGTAQMTATAATDVSPTPTLKVGAGVETPEFGQGLAERVSWMVDNNMDGAKLQVNPPQLGPIEVRIAVQGDHAQVWLTSHSAVTRDALEASSPKLREMLGAQGFGQVSVDISQRSFQERSPQAHPYDWTPTASGGASTAPPASAAISMPRISSSAVDAYA
jgi:flagellar hook-length control protein FliK